MHRRTLFALGGAFCAAPAFAASKLPLDAISRYINGITAAKTDFTQINDDGTLSTGHALYSPARADAV